MHTRLQDSPEYFTREGGYVAYTPDVPAKMLAAAVPKEDPLLRNGTIPHFRLMHHQLLQFRNAWAIAQVRRNLWYALMTLYAL